MIAITTRSSIKVNFPANLQRLIIRSFLSLISSFFQSLSGKSGRESSLDFFSINFT